MIASATVLVVEHDPIARELLEGVLRTAGCRVLSVPTGNAGLLSLCRHQARIDWLVTGVTMPGLVDGWLLADEYHRHNPGRPVVLLSDVVPEAQRSAIDAVFVPPHAPMRVLEALKSLSGASIPEEVPLRMQRAA